MASLVELADLLVELVHFGRAALPRYCDDLRLVNCADCGKILRGDTQPNERVEQIASKYARIAGRFDGRPLCRECFDSQAVKLVERTVDANH